MLGVSAGYHSDFWLGVVGAGPVLIVAQAVSASSYVDRIEKRAATVGVMQFAIVAVAYVINGFLAAFPTIDAIVSLATERDVDSVTRDAALLGLSAFTTVFVATMTLAWALARSMGRYSDRHEGDDTGTV